MIQSMTGYGAAQHVERGVAFSVEVRSVNGRYLKLALKLPDTLQFLEPSLERFVKEFIARGHVSLNLKMRSESGGQVATLNRATLQAYVDQISDVSLPNHVKGTIDLGSLASLPGVCEQPVMDESEQARILEIVETLTREALTGLTQMRREEGAALREDLAKNCKSIRDELTIVEQRSPCVVEEYHERLKTRVGQLMKQGGYELEADGLMREVAIYAERCDISEELARLKSHLGQFDDLCENSGQVGRRLDFLAQELLREANTIASKSNDATIARSVVEIKAMIDRVKEQVQNVE